MKTIKDFVSQAVQAVLSQKGVADTAENRVIVLEIFRDNTDLFDEMSPLDPRDSAQWKIAVLQMLIDERLNVIREMS